MELSHGESGLTTANFKHHNSTIFPPGILAHGHLLDASTHGVTACFSCLLVRDAAMLAAAEKINFSTTTTSLPRLLSHWETKGDDESVLNIAEFKHGMCSLHPSAATSLPSLAPMKLRAGISTLGRATTAKEIKAYFVTFEGRMPSCRPVAEMVTARNEADCIPAFDTFANFFVVKTAPPTCNISPSALWGGAERGFPLVLRHQVSRRPAPLSLTIC
jgi:hypothetical protein